MTSLHFLCPGRWMVSAAVAGVLPFAAPCLHAQQTTTVVPIHTFDATEASDNISPRPSGLIQGRDGNFYGTTAAGGANGQGSVYRMTPTGVLTTLYSFSPRTSNGNLDGASPGGLIQGSDGNFYGTTIYFGQYYSGTIFKITPAGEFTVLHSLDAIDNNRDNVDGIEPGSLVEGGDGNFYGVGAESGAHNSGTVFKISPAGQFTVLHTFSAGTRNNSGYLSNPDGYNPTSLVRGADDNFYGTTYQGGPDGTGTVFRITPAGVFTTLHAFSAPTSYQDFSNTDGIGPVSGLTLGRDGNFYGATINGGADANGAIYKITPDGVFTTLHNFTDSEVVPGLLSGAGANTLVLGNDGNFYGTLVGGISGTGTIYRLTPEGAVTSLYQFSASTGQTSTGLATNPEGQSPGALIQGSDGALYGAAYSGDSTGFGTIFKATVPGVHPSFFKGEAALGNGVGYLAFANGNPFGYYSYLDDPHYIYHFDLGYEYVFDGYDGKDGVYLYDFESNGFFYTSPVFPFPYLYDFSLNAVLYYYPDPNHAGRYNTNGVRYFYNFATGKIISK